MGGDSSRLCHLRPSRMTWKQSPDSSCRLTNRTIFLEAFPMRTNLIRAVLALAVVLAVSAPVAAQSVIRGKVVDAQGKPVEGATVSIEATESNRKAQTKTNKNGEFLQIGLASGRYNVTVEKDKLKQ